jgi:hypothetical protein
MLSSLPHTVVHLTGVVSVAWVFLESCTVSALGLVHALIGKFHQVPSLRVSPHRSNTHGTMHWSHIRQDLGLNAHTQSVEQKNSSPP